MMIIKLVFILLIPCLQFAQQVHGDLIQFHKVTIDFNGPVSSETAELNPFTDFRLDVTFKGLGVKSIGNPPKNNDTDWSILIRRKEIK